jgi:hypothetical protein
MKDKVFRPDGWNHILIEGYCDINRNYHNKQSKWVYVWDTKGKDFMKNSKDHRQPNPDYDPTAKPDEKPVYCKGYVCIACLNAGNMCDHFNYCSVEKKLKKKFRKLIHKMYIK